VKRRRWLAAGPIPLSGCKVLAECLGLNIEEMNLGWVARYVSPDGRACVQLVTQDATRSHDSVLSVHVGDGVDEAYTEA
jgi:hypothetical protein